VNINFVIVIVKRKANDKNVEIFNYSWNANNNYVELVNKIVNVKDKYVEIVNI